jgi:tetratricopeptide (TPR) repeat protein
MTYDDAAYTFDQVMAKDPDCFWGYWGKAMTYIHPLWPDFPTPEELETGYVLSQKATALAKSDKEKLYAATVAAYYAKSEKTKPERQADMQAAWAAAAQQLPDDPEAALFNGLFRLSLVPPTDKTFAVQTEVGAMAEKYIEKYPDHPGAFHYAIHAYDVPPLAEKALFVSRNYGKIAPEIPHALHMPSHIFTRLGYWQESIDWNTRSYEAARRLPLDGKISPHFMHALDYMVYAMLQFGEDRKAAEAMHMLDTLTMPLQINPASAYARAAIPARIPLETHDWAAAAKIVVPDTTEFTWKKYPQYEALLYFAKGIGSARSDDMAGAQAALDKLTSLQAAIGNAPQAKYWNDQIESQKGSITAWMSLASGKSEAAIAQMTAAADLEDGMQKNPVSPGSLLPAREMLGDMYAELGKYAEAVAAYEQSLKTNPNRYNSFYGAGMASEKMKDMQKAKSYYARLVELKGKTDSTRESLAHAKQLVSAG